MNHPDVGNAKPQGQVSTSGHLAKSLAPLALATFAVGTDAFVIAGLLPAIATSFDVSIPAAGQLVTVFALTFAIAAPVLSWLMSSLDRRKALQLALLVFIIGNVATAISPTYSLALAARVFTALGAATITATASSAAVAITPPERRGRAMALVIGGLTLSTALGMPLGNLIGSVDWRFTLWDVAGLGVVAMIGMATQGEVARNQPDCPLGSIASDQSAYNLGGNPIGDGRPLHRLHLHWSDDRQCHSRNVPSGADLNPVRLG